MFSKLKKIPYLNLIPILLIAFIMYRVVNHPEILSDSFHYITSIFSYIIWAFAIAYLLNPMMVYLEKRLKINRALSITVIYLVFVVIIFFAITIITPSLKNNMDQLLDNFPKYIDQTEKWVTESVNQLKTNDKYGITKYIQDNINSIFNQTSDLPNKVLGFLFNKTIGFTSTVMKLIFGLLISIYLLKDKEVLIRSIKRMIYAFLEKDNAEILLNICKRVNLAFSKYIIGKIVDSLIIGIICFLGLFILKVPFAVLISIIIGLSNLIPYVGGFIGLVPATLIIIFTCPDKTVWVLIFLILLQQFDGWILSPKIIGDKVGLSPILLIAALMVGGAVYGIIGMFLAIPLTAVVKEFIGAYVEDRLKSKDYAD